MFNIWTKKKKKKEFKRIDLMSGKRWKEISNRTNCKLHLGRFTDKVGSIETLHHGSEHGSSHDDSKNFYAPYNYE